MKLNLSLIIKILTIIILRSIVNLDASASELWKNYLKEQNGLINRVNDLFRSGVGRVQKDSAYSIYCDIFENIKEFQFRADQIDFFLDRQIFTTIKTKDFLYSELDRAVNEGDENKIAKALDGLGDHFFYSQKNDTALMLYNKEMEIYTTLKNQRELGNVVLKIGQVYYYQGIYVPAMVTFELAIETVSKYGDKAQLVSALNGLGNIYMNLEAFEFAKPIFFRAQKIANDINNKELLLNTYVFISKFYEENKQYSKANEYLFKVLNNDSLSDNFLKSFACFRLGQNFARLNITTTAEFYYLKSIELAKQISNADLIMTSSYGLGELYKNSDDLEKALSYVNDAWALVKNTDKYKDIVKVSSLLNSIYVSKQDYHLAYFYLAAKDQAVDSLISLYKKNVGEKDKYWMSYARMYKKERSVEVESENTKQHRKNLILFWCIVNILVLSFLVILLVKQYKRIKRDNLVLSARNKTILSQNKQLTKKNVQLIKSEKELNELNLTKDKFFSIVAHDLKSPLIEIIRLFEYDISKKSSKNPYEDDNNTKVVLDSLKSLYSFLENLLQWSKSQCNLVSAVPRRYYLEDIINPIVGLLNSFLNKKNIKLHNLIRKEHTVFADYSMLTVVFRNILYNAIKFTPGNKNIYIESVYKTGFVKIFIRDEGVGISDEHQKNLFRIDKNFSSKGTNGESGSGLGLILCKEFVVKNKGLIGVISQENKGSSFWVKIPYREGIYLSVYV